MLAQVDDRIGTEAVGEPGIGREVAMRRHQSRVVIGRLWVEVVAARRLHQHSNVAAAKSRDREPPAIEPSRTEERVALGRSPLRRDALLHRGGEAREEGGIFGEGQGLVRPRRRPGVGRAGQQARHQRGAVFRNVANAVPGLVHGPQHIDCGLRRIEADAVADAAVAVRVIGEDDRDAPLGGRLDAQPCPVARQIGDESDPVGDRAIADEIGLGLGIAAIWKSSGRCLERHGARQDAAVDLGQGDIHRQVARAQTPRAGAPCLFVAAREHHLQDRAVDAQRVGAAGGGDGKTGRVEDDGRRMSGEQLRQQGRCLGILQAVHENRQGSQLPGSQSLNQPGVNLTCLS